VGVVLLRVIYLERDLDICLVVYDNELEFLLIFKVTLSDYKIKYIDSMGIYSFLDVYKSAAHKGNCVVMWNSNIFFKNWSELKWELKAGFKDVDEYYKNYNFVILKKYMKADKTTKDLIIL
jgi:hypothetical protein